MCYACEEPCPDCEYERGRLPSKRQKKKYVVAAFCPRCVIEVDGPGLLPRIFRSRYKKIFKKILK